MDFSVCFSGVVGLVSEVVGVSVLMMFCCFFIYVFIVVVCVWFRLVSWVFSWVCVWEWMVR